MTTFFEVINISATHIYHSALELSPLSSVTRELYYHQHCVPFPRVATGILGSWSPGIAISSIGCDKSSITWSPCNQFVATQTEKVVKIWDALTFILLSTLYPSKPTSQLTGALAYSPDGYSLACASDTAMIIWDIQTGGVAKEIQCNGTYNDSLVWSSDGRSICTTGQGWGLSLCVYDVVSGTVLPPITHWSQGTPHLWPHNNSFRLMTTDQKGGVHTVDIYEVDSTPIKIESFPIQLGGSDYRIKSFSPSSYRISVKIYGDDCQLLILDIQNLGLLLTKGGDFSSHCFSPDGSLFAASHEDSVHIWKYDNDHYNPWREFTSPDYSNSESNFSFLFSPSSSSILGCFWNSLQLWRLNGPSIAPTTHVEQLGIFSYSGTHIITAHYRESVVTIANLLSHIPSQFIDTNIEISDLGLTGNVLLVVGSEKVQGSVVVMAWLLAKEGLVNGVFDKRRADHSDSIWTLPAPQDRPWALKFSFEGETGLFESDRTILQIYNIRTGEALEPTEQPLHLHRHRTSILDMMYTQYKFCNHLACNIPPWNGWGPSQTILEEGWIKDCEGKHLLWLPIEWRATDWENVDWFPDIVQSNSHVQIVHLLSSNSTSQTNTPLIWNVIHLFCSSLSPCSDHIRPAVILDLYFITSQ